MFFVFYLYQHHNTTNMEKEKEKKIAKQIFWKDIVGRTITGN